MKAGSHPGLPVTTARSVLLGTPHNHAPMT